MLLDHNFHARSREDTISVIGTPLQHAASHDNLDCFVHLLKHGTNLHYEPVGAVNIKPILAGLAAWYGSLKVVRYLLEDRK